LASFHLAVNSAASQVRQVAARLSKRKPRHDGLCAGCAHGAALSPRRRTADEEANGAEAATATEFVQLAEKATDPPHRLQVARRGWVIVRSQFMRDR